MRKRSIFTVPAAAAGIIALGLTLGAVAPIPGVGAPTPTVSCEEDMPCWDPAACAEIGNQVCGTATDADVAWQVWEEQDGARQLRVDPSRPFKVQYMVSTPDAPQNMDTYDLALLGKDGRYYVFRAEYTDTTI